jgi:hypothetical protein
MARNALLNETELRRLSQDETPTLMDERTHNPNKAVVPMSLDRSGVHLRIEHDAYWMPCAVDESTNGDLARASALFALETYDDPG